MKEEECKMEGLHDAGLRDKLGLACRRQLQHMQAGCQEDKLPKDKQQVPLIFLISSF